MLARVRLSLADGSSAMLAHGELIGRLESAAWRINRPTISQAHAIVVHRDADLYLVSLRRLLVLKERRLNEVCLRSGQQIALAQDVLITVDEVAIPDDRAVLESRALGPCLLPPVSSIFAGTPPRLVPRFDPTADAHVWFTGAGWKVHVDDKVRDLVIGDRFFVGESFQLTKRNLAGFHEAQQTMPGGILPVHIVIKKDLVELHHGEKMLMMTGSEARIVAELAAFRGPVAWGLLAKELWPSATGSDLLEHWSVCLRQIALKFKGAGIRSSLIARRGSQIQLDLRPGDQVEILE